MSHLPRARTVHPGRRVGRRSRLGLGLVIGTLLAALLATGASAATPKVTFFFNFGDGCIYGTAKPNASIKVVVHSAAGKTIGKGTTQIDSDGYWQFCDFYAVVRPGMSVDTTVFNTKGTLSTASATVPDLAIKVDRDADTVSGRAPANSTISISLSDYLFDHWGQSYDVYEVVPVGSSGSWSHDFGADGINIRGGAMATVEWLDSAATIDAVRLAFAPQVGLTRNTPEFGGFTRMNGGVSISLTDGVNELASGHAAGDWQVGSYWGLLSDPNDELYDLQGGEWLTATGIGSGVSWQVPTGIASVNKATDVVAGKCFSHGRYVVEAWNNGYLYGIKYGTAAANGSFSKDMSSKINLKRGITVNLTCFTGAGDYFVDQRKLK
jgi:hypothetical protein